MVFLTDPTQRDLLDPAAGSKLPKRDGSYTLADLTLDSLHSVQLSGDPESESFVLSALVRQGADYNLRQFLLQMKGSVLQNPVELGAATKQPSINTYVMAVPSRTAIEYFYRSAANQPYVLYKAMEPTLVPDAAIPTRLKLKLNLYANFADATPATAFDFVVDFQAGDDPMLVCIYGPPYGRPGTVRVILFGREQQNKDHIIQLQAWSIDGDGKTTKLSTPMKFATEVQERTTPGGPTALLTCSPCQVWIEYTPGEADMTEYKRCGKNLTVTEIDTDGYEVLEITLYAVDLLACDSVFVEYRAWPPGNVSEVDCRQDKTDGVWGDPSCSEPDDVVELLGLSRFGFNTDAGPEIIELGIGRNAAGELVEYERRWNTQTTPLDSASGCPINKEVSGRREHALTTPALLTGIHHAAARAWSYKFLAKTTLTKLGGVDVLGVYLWEPDTT